MRGGAWRRTAVVMALAASVLAPPAAAVAPGTNVLISRSLGLGALTAPITNDSSTTGDPGGAGSLSARTISNEESQRYVAFVSEADGLSGADDDSATNVYVRDRATATTILVSRANGPGGAGANGDSTQPAITANGRYVAFTSDATNLAAGASGTATHVYVRDVISGVTFAADRADGPDGALANDAGFVPSITVVAGNPVIAFASVATNLDGPSNNVSQIYVRDGLGDETSKVSRRDGSLSSPNATAIGGGSRNPSISTDGTAVAFESDATNLISIDFNDATDIFVRTRAANGTENATLGNGDSFAPSISGTGNEVAFTSEATDLETADASPDEDVYALQLSSGELRLLSRQDGSAGAKGAGASSEVSINDSGDVAVFSSGAANLDSPDTNGVQDVFMRSGIFGVAPNTTLVSRPFNGAQSSGPSVSPSIPRTNTGINNYRIPFQTQASNMGADDDDDFTQIYQRTTGTVAGTTNPAVLISRPSGTGVFRSGVNESILRPPGRGPETVVATSANGRYTVFLSASDELSPEDGNGFVNVFRRDNQTATTTLVSRADGLAGAAANATSASLQGALVPPPTTPQGAPSISADGNRIAFASAASNLVAGDVNNRPDVFVRDVAGGRTLLASRQPNGAIIPAVGSGEAAISGDGNRVAFATDFSMDAQDANGDADVYLRDLGAGTTTLVSRRGPAAPAGNGGSGQAALDFDGSHVAFASSATDLTPVFADTNLEADVFLHRVGPATTSLLSQAAAGMSTANNGAIAPAIDSTGTRVAFSSASTNLGAVGDVNGALPDVFVRDVAGASTVLASRTSGANGVSGNGGSERVSLDATGTRVAFESLASNLVPGDGNGSHDVFVRDTAAQTTVLVSRGPGGALAPEGAGTPSLAANGDCIMFETRADDLFPMPPGVDFFKVVGRALRGDCPFEAVAGGGGGGGGGGGPAADRTKPVISKVSIKPKRFLAGRKVRRRTRRRPAVGAILRYRLSEQAAVRVKVQRLLRGRRKGGRCLTGRRTPKRGRRCTRAVTRGTLRAVGRQGANRLKVTGTLRGKRLAAGRHRLTIVAKDPAGNSSAPRRRRFVVLRRR